MNTTSLFGSSSDTSPQLRALVRNTTQWGYRIPFAIQWIWVCAFASDLRFPR